MMDAKRLSRYQHLSRGKSGPADSAAAVVKLTVSIPRESCTNAKAKILRLRIGARLTRYRNCKFHNFARTISPNADGISRYSVPPSAGPLLPLTRWLAYDVGGLPIMKTRQEILFSSACEHIPRTTRPTFANF